MTKKLKSSAHVAKRQEIPPPSSLEGVTSYQRQIATCLRRMNERKAHVDARRQALDEEEEQLLAPLRKDVLAIAQAIYKFARAHRAVLTENEKSKTVQVPHAGLLQWAFTPPSIDLGDTDEVELIALLKKCGLNDCVRRSKEEVDKEALLAALTKKPETLAKLAGVSIKQVEMFIIKPADVNERIVHKNRSWKIDTPKKSK